MLWVIALATPTSVLFPGRRLYARNDTGGTDDFREADWISFQA